MYLFIRTDFFLVAALVREQANATPVSRTPPRNVLVVMLTDGGAAKSEIVFVEQTIAIVEGTYMLNFLCM